VKKTALPVTAVAVAAALIALLAYGLTSTGEDHSLDQKVANGVPVKAPSRLLPVLDKSGKSSLAEHRGQVVLLNFWANWCEPCKAEAPLLEKTQKRISGEDATVLGVTFDTTVHDARNFVDKYSITYPSLRDIGKNLAHAYGTTKLPESFLIDRHGRIRAISRGEIDQKWIDANLRPLLKG
jgi:cytochrome c biogenesis protein CcmG/thiol:disulfide interchange protein DsbE